MTSSIKFWRTERQISQIALAAATGIPRHRIQLTEQMLLKLTRAEMKRICKVLGISEGQCECKEVADDTAK